MVAGFFSEFAYWFLLFIILLNISQRKIAHSDGKRKATILLAVVMLVLQVLLAMRMQLKLPEWVDWCSVALCLLVIIIFHRTFWPFRLRCAKCGKRLDFNHIIGCDENLCEDCFCEMYPEYAEEKRRKAMTAEQRLEETFTKAGKVSDIPWDEWEATEKCVLTYVIDGSRVLMIEKKTGLGAGYINAPGGHIEIEETKAEAAIRETKEETGLDVSDLEERGVLRFQFKDGLRMLGYVFFTSSFSGELIEETEETKPFWTDISTLDYSRMWEDDRLWLPMALEGRKFDGRFIFDDKAMLDAEVIEEEGDEDTDSEG